MPKIIILRGNSSSGKSTVAKILQERVGRGTLVISQDYVRREMLWVKDEPGNQAIDLMENLARYGRQNCEAVILEGILYTDVYESLFRMVKELYKDKIFAYYFDIPFEETLRRHVLRPNANDFGEAEMKSWWREKDFLPDISERIINEDSSAEETVERIYNDIYDIEKR